MLARGAGFLLAAVAIVLAAPRAALPTIESAKALTITLISRLVPLPAAGLLPELPAAATPELLPPAAPAQPTAVPVRARWEFGALLPYVVQSGDTLPALAARFNQTTDAILKANPALAVFQSTLPPGRAINIPASYAPLLGSAFHMLPDSAVVYAADPGETAAQLQNFDGWLAHRHEPAYSARAGSWDEARPSWDLINEVALQYSVDPRVLLALLEYRSGLLRNADAPADAARNPLRLPPDTRTGIANQLEWAAAQLNEGYYAWRAGTQVELRLLDGTVQRIDPWQNAGTVALLQLFSQLEQPAEFEQSIGPQGFAATYQQLFGVVDEQDRAVYELLLGVSGVGPKVALAIWSAVTPEALRTQWVWALARMHSAWHCAPPAWDPASKWPQFHTQRWQPSRRLRCAVPHPC